VKVVSAVQKQPMPNRTAKDVFEDLLCNKRSTNINKMSYEKICGIKNYTAKRTKGFVRLIVVL
jgi:hypothetical protein